MKETLSSDRRIKRGQVSELLMVVYFLPVMSIALVLAYPILIARLAWDASSKMFRKFVDNE